MDSKISNTFLILILLQGAHAVEEYAGSLWEVFEPANYITGIISNDREFAYVLINVLFLIGGFIVWLIIKRSRGFIAVFFLWVWILIALINGLGHTVFSISRLEYIPGLITAPLLFIIAVMLARKLTL